MDGDLVISSMPVKDLVEGMNDVPEKPMADCERTSVS